MRGTEVLPGERKFTDYAIPPGYSAIETVLGPGQGYDRQPFNGYYDVPNNPRYSGNRFWNQKTRGESRAFFFCLA